MAEKVVLTGRDGNYYAFDAEAFEAKKASDDDGSEFYDVTAEELEAARVPDDAREDVEDAVGIDEVAGFGEPIPGIDVKLGKNPGGAIFSMAGTFSTPAAQKLPGPVLGAASKATGPTIA